MIKPILFGLFLFTIIYNQVSGQLYPTYECMTVDPDVSQTMFNAVLGYINLDDETVVVPIGISSQNFFSPGALTYQGHPSSFNPGKNYSAFTIPVNISTSITWYLQDSTVQIYFDPTRYCPNTSALIGPAGPMGFNGSVGAVGEQGPQGIQGVPGVNGSQGPQGIQGLQGVQGETGANGTQGEKGDQGDIGPQGDPGEPGPPGANGTDGAQGPQGFNGSQGIQGIQGIQGVQGPQGFNGSQGEQGLQGVQGPQGFNGSQGPKGDTGDTGQPGRTGNTGPPGPPGSLNVSSSCRYVNSYEVTSEEALQNDQYCGTTATAYCVKGEFGISGGGSCDGIIGIMSASKPGRETRYDKRYYWTVRCVSIIKGQVKATATILCCK